MIMPDATSAAEGRGGAEATPPRSLAARHALGSSSSLRAGFASVHPLQIGAYFDVTVT